VRGARDARALEPKAVRAARGRVLDLGVLFEFGLFLCRRVVYCCSERHARTDAPQHEKSGGRGGRQKRRRLTAAAAAAFFDMPP
jgi:hypothetical protein